MRSRNWNVMSQGSRNNSTTSIFWNYFERHDNYTITTNIKTNSNNLLMLNMNAGNDGFCEHHRFDTNKTDQYDITEIWISNVICHGLFYVQWFNVRGDNSLCWYWLELLTNTDYLSFHKYSYNYILSNITIASFLCFKSRFFYFYLAYHFFCLAKLIHFF